MTEVGPTVRLSATPAAARDQAHSPGQDNEAVFGEILGMSTSKIKDLIEREVLF
jgi:crotonobetainyl-CoA:carnitine CoA-transferase CaiB-like acyl-CoA transferase